MFWKKSMGKVISEDRVAENILELIKDRYLQIQKVLIILSITLLGYNMLSQKHFYIFSNYSVYIIFVGSLGILSIISFSLNSILCPLYTWPFPFPSYPFTLCCAKICQVCFPQDYQRHWMCSLLPDMNVSLFLYCFSSLSLLTISPISLSISLGIFSSCLVLS